MEFKASLINVRKQMGFTWFYRGDTTLLIGVISLSQNHLGGQIGSFLEGIGVKTV